MPLDTLPSLPWDWPACQAQANRMDNMCSICCGHRCPGVHRDPQSCHTCRGHVVTPLAAAQGHALGSDPGRDKRELVNKNMCCLLGRTNRFLAKTVTSEKKGSAYHGSWGRGHTGLRTRHSGQLCPSLGSLFLFSHPSGRHDVIRAAVRRMLDP